MTTVQPYHSTRLGSAKVHHDQANCWDGNNIEQHYFKLGTGGYPLCQTCLRLKAAWLRQRALLLKRRP